MIVFIGSGLQCWAMTAYSIAALLEFALKKFLVMRKPMNTVFQELKT